MGGLVVASTIRFESHARIRRPIDVVFERLADLTDYGQWMNRRGLFRRSGLTSEAPVREGTTYFDATRMGTFDGEVTEFVRPTRIAFSETLRWFGSPMIRARPQFVLLEEDGATVVHHIAVGELFGPARIMKPAARMLTNGERTRTLDSLRRSLESE